MLDCASGLGEFSRVEFAVGLDEAGPVGPFFAFVPLAECRLPGLSPAICYGQILQGLPVVSDQCHDVGSVPKSKGGFFGVGHG